MASWYNLNLFLTPRRMTYAWITGAVLWIAWIASSVLGPGYLDLAGQAIGTDYLQFYSSGLTIRSGQSANLYNFEYQAQLERSIVGPGLRNFHAFITPPFLAWLFVPFSLLPYIWSLIAWSLLGIALLWLSIKLLNGESYHNGLIYALSWFPIFATISFGQNSILSLLLFSLSYWLQRKGKPLSAGLIASILLFKPQMVLGLGLLWLLEYRRSWKSLLGLLLGGLVLAGLSFIFLPEASRAYVELSRSFLSQLIYQDQFPLWHLHSLRGFWISLFPGQRLTAELLSLLFSVVGIVAFILVWKRNRSQPNILFASAICLTIWISPHTMIYDWSILLIPALLLWNTLPNQRALWKPLFALVWLTTFLSGPLAYLMLNSLHFAIQISIPILALVLITAYKAIQSDTIHAETAPVQI